MTASIRAWLQAAASDCLDELTAQIAAQAPPDPHCPDLRVNDAFMKAIALLVRLDVEDAEASRSH